MAVNGYSTDVSTAAEVKAAPGAGKSLYITAVVITCNDADSFPWLQDGDAVVVFGRFFTTATDSLGLVKEFKKPIKLTANKALQLKAAAAGNVSIWVEGATAED